MLRVATHQADSETRSMTTDAQMPALARTRLSIMMFLQYAIWGAWLPLLYPFLKGFRNFQDAQIGDMFAIGAVGALLAPFVAGQIADRYFSTEKFLAISHIIGGIIVWQLAKLESYWAFLGFSLAYSIVYAPTLSLTNSICFHNLADRDRDFGKVRVWGTVGWIVIGIAVGQWLAFQYTPDLHEPVNGITTEQLHADPDQYIPRVIEADAKFDSALSADLVGLADQRTITELLDDRGIERPMIDSESGDETLDVQAAIEALGLPASELLEAQVEMLGVVIREKVQQKGMADAFRASALLGILLGLYCLLLPHTPPTKGRQKNAAFEAVSEIKRQPLLMLFLLAVPVSCIHQFYFVHTAGFLQAKQEALGQEGVANLINSVFGVGGGGLMTVGQICEVAVLGLIPFVAKKVSRKSLLAVGLLAYGLRMAIFGYVDALPEAVQLPTLIVGVAMHGFCFGCFIFVAFMVVDEETTPDIRASAQSLFNLVIVGIGIIVGSKIATAVSTWATQNDVLDYRDLFSVPMWASVGCLLVLLLFYPGGRRNVGTSDRQGGPDLTT